MLLRACKLNSWNRQKELVEILTRSFLVKEYIINKKCPYLIATKIKCGSTTVKNYLIKYKIPLRTASEAAHIAKYRKFLRIEKYVTKNLNFIKKEYLINLKPIHVIAKKLHLSYNILRSYMQLNQILIRNKSKCQQGKLNHRYGRNGRLNSNWQGGLSKLPYAFKFTEKLKEKVRKRDNRKCQICGMKEVKNVQIYNQKLAVHHIDYDKQNSEFKNLISLCKECHTKTNFNRDYWYAYCKYIMENYK